MKPPNTIDNAKVLEWAWSGNEPFGEIKDTNNIQPSIKIFGLALCQYEKSGTIYRFSCTEEWECEQDTNYSSIEEAKLNIPKQYQSQKIKWNKT